MLHSASSSAAQPNVLDLGCGRDKLPNALGMDANPHSDADVIHDLDVLPWPLADDSFETVRAQDVLEHVADFFGVMNEIHRVCRHGALVHVRMPFMSSLHFATDPTHRRAGTSSTFDYFDPALPLGRYAYSQARFDKVSFHYGRGYPPGKVSEKFRSLDKLVVPWCERNAATYEHYFAYLYPMHDISYTLRVIKR